MSKLLFDLIEIEYSKILSMTDEQNAIAFIFFYIDILLINKVLWYDALSWATTN